MDNGSMGTSGATTEGRGALAVRSRVGFDEAVSPLPKTGTGAISVGRGAGCTISAENKLACESAGEDNEPAKV